MKEFKQSDPLKGIAKELEEAINNVAVSGREDALEALVSNIYCNNAISERLLEEYPELVDIAEFALEFDYETDAAYLDNRWRLIVDRIHRFTQHLESNDKSRTE